MNTSESTNIPSFENSPTPLRVGQFKAIAINQINFQLEHYSEYLEQTRVDYEQGGPPQPWITEVATALTEAKNIIRTIEIEYSEQLFQKTVSSTEVDEIFLREQNPELFRTCEEKIVHAFNIFEEYFQKHRRMKLGIE